jgi:hypothetical protein
MGSQGLVRLVRLEEQHIALRADIEDLKTEIRGQHAELIAAVRAQNGQTSQLAGLGAKIVLAALAIVAGVVGLRVSTPIGEVAGAEVSAPNEAQP